MTIQTLIPELGPVCRDKRRRAHILAHPELNGIDNVEYEHRPQDSHQHVLVVRFLKPLPDDPQSGPDGAYELTNHPERVAIVGGSRIVGIRVREVRLEDDHLEVFVDKAGDFSNYWLLLGWQRQPDGHWMHDILHLDPPFSIVPVNFKAGCPVDFDCRQPAYCPPDRPDEPRIDYLAKDYASFRQLLLDSIPQLNPSWLERSPADLGIALVELLAYTGDHLSYFQDAVSNEAFLDTARQRVSAKRHARLIDYRMHDGRNAWAFIHLQVGSSGAVPIGTRLLTRITAPLLHETSPPGVVIAEDALPDESYDGDPALRHTRVFETTFPLKVHPENNRIFLHTWGNLNCCLGRGATCAYLYSLDPANTQQFIRPSLEVGDFLLFEEVKGLITGDDADADPDHRQVVQIVDVQETNDPAYNDQWNEVGLQPWQTGNAKLPLLRVAWRDADALRFPLCLSTETPDQAPILNVSVARGNLILADHGRTVVEELPLSNPVPADTAFRIRLDHGPMTMQCQPDMVAYTLDAGSSKLNADTPRSNLICPPGEAKPAVVLLVNFPTNAELWTAVPDLLDSTAFDQHFVVDVDNDGRGRLRFGDGEYGRKVAGAIKFTATYRVGNGRSGNVGGEGLAHIVQPKVASDWPIISGVRNPLPAKDGTDGETIEEVRQRAPAAFRAEQFRAVTEADYTAAARKMPDVAGAVATFRWTGSWYTVYVGVAPRNPTDLITLPGGRTRLVPAFKQRVQAFLTRYKLAGYDLEIRSGEYVPLEIDIDLCVLPDHFRGDVAQAVGAALSNRVNPDRTIGFFHPDKFTFGQAVYLSRLYATVEAVQGVNSLVVTRFQRYGGTDHGELKAGVMPIGPWEIARLDNDPNFMENGVLRITARGGK